MAQMGRPGLSTAQKAELWRRWKDGQSLSDIGRALGKRMLDLFMALSLLTGESYRRHAVGPDWR
jgi:hypothetical protein